MIACLTTVHPHCGFLVGTFEIDEYSFLVRTRAALYALDMLRRMALGLDVPDSVRFTPETTDRELDI